MNRTSIFFSKAGAVLGSLMASVIYHLMIFFAGKTADGDIIWAVIDGAVIWAVFSLVILILSKALLPEIGVIAALVLGGLLLWLALSIVSTPFSVAFGWLWLIAIPHVITGAVSAGQFN